MKVLFVTPYPFDTAGSQRFRFEQYFTALNQNNISYDCAPFWDQKAWLILYQKQGHFKKMIYLFRGLFKRFLLLFKLKSYDYIFIHRELFPVGFNFLIKLYHHKNKKIIYDFDDAIWLPNFAENNKRFAFLKSYSQVELLCKKAYKISVGNEFLKKYAAQFNSNIIINPTTIDTNNYHTGTIDYDFNQLTIGWTGTHSTMKYLPDILPVLDKLREQYNFSLKVISDKHPNFNRSYLNYVPWNKDSEIDDLKTIHIGLMPLHDDKWSSGKCGFKALQYMSVGMPAIVSPVGVNESIIDEGKNGFLCETIEDWEKALKFFLNHPKEVKSYGLNAKDKIEKNFSVNANTPNFLKLFK